MLALLPASFLLLAAISLAAKPTQHAGRAWGTGLASGVIAAGVVVVFSSELLGAFDVLGRVTIVATWILAIAGLSFWGRKNHRLGLPAGALRFSMSQGRVTESGIVSAMGGFALILLAVALASPPNNVDSLLYHMSRVAHWAQQASLDHYPTGYQHQLFMPPLAELMILHLRLLAGGDGLSALVQWTAMLGSVILAGELAGHLGAGRPGKLLSSAYVISIPMGILQATSTQNDYVVGLMILCVAYLTVAGPDSHRGSVWIGLAVGLALLTKATSYVYVIPWVIWLAVRHWRKSGFGGLARFLAIVVVAVTLTNGGFWLRNIQTYGGPLGPPEFVSGFAAGQGLIERIAPRALLARPVTMAARNLVTPALALNKMAYAVAARFPAVFGDDFGSTMAAAAWSHEDTAGNPVHLLVAVAAGIAAVWRLGKNRRVEVHHLYLAAIASSFLLVATVISNSPTLDGLRFQLPLFVLAGPMVGIVVSRFRWMPLPYILGVLLLATSIPWLLFNNTRPVIGRPPWPTRVDSVFRESASNLMFAMDPTLHEPFTGAINRLDDSGCKEVGLRIDSSDPEYQLWWLLGAPESGYRVETIYSSEVLERYKDPSFSPCAIVCMICADRERLHGLEIAFSQSGVNLYLGDGYQPAP